MHIEPLDRVFSRSVQLQFIGTVSLLRRAYCLGFG
ncbi:hypothetical protein LR68_01124 [Anoxybacillus sp. BCO1]|nr:hypothetical protein LR68_01124 [Anoxybacillus sp. BCO1]